MSDNRSLRESERICARCTGFNAPTTKLRYEHCTHREAARSRLSGEPIYGLHIAQARSAHGSCGPDGEYFDPKDGS